MSMAAPPVMRHHRHQLSRCNHQGRTGQALILNKLEQKLTRLQHKANDVVNRVRDRHIRLAVTGLSRSGKTAFITALVNQLEHAAIDGRLPLWDALRQGASSAPAGCRSSMPTSPPLPTSVASTPVWRSTCLARAHRGVAEVRLEIRYRTRHPLRKHLGRSPPSTWIWWTTPGSGCSTCRCWR